MTVVNKITMVLEKKRDGKLVRRFAGSTLGRFGATDAQILTASLFSSLNTAIQVPRRFLLPYLPLFLNSFPRFFSLLADPAAIGPPRRECCLASVNSLVPDICSTPPLKEESAVGSVAPPVDPSHATPSLTQVPAPHRASPPSISPL